MIFICNEYSFIDKYCNAEIKIIPNIKSFKTHAMKYNNILSKGCLSLKRISYEYVLLKSNNEIYVVNKKIGIN